MKFTALLAAAAGLLISAQPAAATDIGVSIEFSQPGVYGRIDVGRYPRPAVVVAQPVIVVPPRAVIVSPQPVYLWVPPGHRKKWHRHCHRYNACGVPVLFVRDDWYEEHVHYGSERKGRGRGKDRD